MRRKGALFIVVSSIHGVLIGRVLLYFLSSFVYSTQCPGLEFQVWDRVCDTSPSTDGQVDDSYIGCARVDLSTLALGLPQISGWYNIMDFGGQIQGQVKV